MTLAHPPAHTKSAYALSPLLIAVMLLLALLGGSGVASAAKAPVPAEEEFGRLVTMSPMTVKGETLQIAIFAHSGGDRRYGRKFAEQVIGVISDTVTPSTGKGLVIVGMKGEPHPLSVFRKFVALAETNKLHPEIAARMPELNEAMNCWKSIIEGPDKGDTKDGPDLEFEKIQAALPIPLAGLAAKLYQLAWEEHFDEAKVEARMCGLKPGDLERRDLFKRYDWAFYLPPKGAFEQVIDELISTAMKEEKAGFMTRMFVKGVMLAVRPQIRRAIEGFRQAMLFMTVVQARTPFSEQDVKALTDVYVHPFMPDDKGKSSEDREQLVKALRAKMVQLNLTPVNAD